MSDRLAIASVVSVLTMAAYVLLGGDAVRAPLGPQGLASRLTVEAPALPSPERLLPALR